MSASSAQLATEMRCLRVQATAQTQESTGGNGDTEEARDPNHTHARSEGEEGKEEEEGEERQQGWGGGGGVGGRGGSLKSVIKLLERLKTAEKAPGNILTHPITRGYPEQVYANFCKFGKMKNFFEKLT